MSTTPDTLHLRAAARSMSPSTTTSAATDDLTRRPHPCRLRHCLGSGCTQADQATKDPAPALLYLPLHSAGRFSMNAQIPS